MRACNRTAPGKPFGTPCVQKESLTMDVDVKKILQDLGDTAANVAGEAKRVTEKSAAAKAGIELASARSAQDHVFADIGRLMYALKVGAYDEDEDGESNAQQKIDALLISAEQKQQDIDRLSHAAQALAPGKVCPGCGKRCSESAVFCPACGGKL